MKTPTSAPPSPKAARLLVVEDDAGMRDTVHEIFASLDWQVLAVEDGEAALEVARTFAPDVILSDIGLPGQDGFEMLARLRVLPELIGVPVIFLTGHAEPSEVRRGMESGADDYLVKPFEPEQLIRAVETRLKRRRALEESATQFRLAVASTLPHELRTPLVGVLGFAELLITDANEAGARGNIAPETVRDRALYIQQSGRRLLELVQRYTLWVDLTARADELRAQRATWSSKDAINHALERVRLQAQEKNRLKDLQVALAPALLAVPESYLGLVLAELVDNALKFSRPGQSVGLFGLLTPRHYEIVVRDAGRGFPEGSAGRIAAFVQFDRAYWEQTGVGLGLAIAKQFAAVTQGELAITSREGDTRVTLRVPLAGVRP